jgi:hypothetical protein
MVCNGAGRVTRHRCTGSNPCGFGESPREQYSHWGRRGMQAVPSERELESI